MVCQAMFRLCLTVGLAMPNCKIPYNVHLTHDRGLAPHEAKLRLLRGLAKLRSHQIDITRTKTELSTQASYEAYHQKLTQLSYI